MNGADNDDWYEAIDNLRCANKKMKAFGNLIDERMIINTGTILVRGVNEQAVEKMFSLAARSQAITLVLKFRNIGAIGNYDAASEENNLSFDEIAGLVANEIGQHKSDLMQYDRIKGFTEENSLLFPIVEGSAAPGS
jgi:hypothetical protein